jgi:hypothetical protein
LKDKASSIPDVRTVIVCRLVLQGSTKFASQFCVFCSK